MDKAKKSSQKEKQRQECEAFVEQVFQAADGVFKIFSIYIGHKLGYYRILADNDPLTSTQLSLKSKTHERYTREWLEQQTIARVLQVENANDKQDKRRYRLPAGHAEALTARESLNYIAPLAQLIAGATSPLTRIVKAYKSGKGVAYEAVLI